MDVKFPLPPECPACGNNHPQGGVFWDNYCRDEVDANLARQRAVERSADDG